MSSLDDLLTQTGDSEAVGWGDIESLAAQIVKAACEKDLWIASAESCTGGLVSGAITAVSGSSAMFMGGVASYAFSAKTGILGVLQETLDAHGAVSHECARDMCEGALRIFGADIAVSTTGIAGPAGAVPGKPVGTVCFGITSSIGTNACTRHFSGDREQVRFKSVHFALELIHGVIEDI